MSMAIQQRLCAVFAKGGARAIALILAAALLVFAPGQTNLPPGDRDESRFAQASKQMLETGDFIDIRFQEEARHKKPVGVYWLQAASASIFGGADAPIAAYRAPSFVGAALAVALTGWALAPLIGWPAAALAAAAMAGSALLHVEARIAKTDAALLASITLAMGALARLWLDEARSWGTRATLWIAVGAGVLLKGPIILIPVIGALLWLGISQRQTAPLWRMKPLHGLGIVALMVAPWLIAITLKSDGGFWAESVGEDMLGKVAGGQEAHGAPPGYHLAFFWGAFWPFAAFAPLGAVWLWVRRKQIVGAFLLGWIVPAWIIFEITPTKLPHYVIVAYPAIAGAIAAAMLDERLWRDASMRLRRIAFGLWVIPAAVLCLGGALAVPVIEGRVSIGAAAFALAGAVALSFAGRALWRWERGAFLGAAIPGAALLYAGIFGFALPGLDRAFVSPRLAAATEAHRCGAEGPVGLTYYREPSAVFLLGTETVMANGRGMAEALGAGRVSFAWIEERDREAFDEAAAALGLRPVPLDELTGFNYSRGKPVDLTLFATRAHAAHCAAGG